METIADSVSLGGFLVGETARGAAATLPLPTLPIGRSSDTRPAGFRVDAFSVADSALMGIPRGPCSAQLDRMARRSSRRACPGVV